MPASSHLPHEHMLVSGILPLSRSCSFWYAPILPRSHRAFRHCLSALLFALALRVCPILLWSLRIAPPWSYDSKRTPSMHPCPCAPSRLGKSSPIEKDTCDCSTWLIRTQCHPCILWVYTWSVLARQVLEIRVGCTDSLAQTSIMVILGSSRRMASINAPSVLDESVDGISL